MRLDMTGKVALITGGAQGLGAAEAAKLLEWGARVVIGDLREDEGRSFVAQKERAGHLGRIAFVKMDVTEMADWMRAVDFAGSLFGPLTTLVNNAGFPGRPGVEATTEE